jgi:hypothetical protein
MANKPILIPDGVGFGDETLSKYDEGTWTPTDASGAGLTITVARGKYTRIGNVCYYNAVITYPATADGTNAKISLPVATTDASAVGSVLEATGTAITALSGSSGINFYNASGAVRTNANLTLKTLYVTGWYNIT